MESLRDTIQSAQITTQENAQQSEKEEAARQALDTRLWTSEAVELAAQQIWDGASEETKQKAADFVSYMQAKQVPKIGYYKVFEPVRSIGSTYGVSKYIYETTSPALEGWVAIRESSYSTGLDYDYDRAVPGVFVADNGRTYLYRGHQDQAGEAIVIPWKNEEFAMPTGAVLDGERNTERIVGYLQARKLI